MSRGIIGADAYKLKTSARVAKTDPYSQAILTVNGKDFDVDFDINGDGDIITLDYQLPVGTLTTTSSCSLSCSFTFPKGTFILGIKDGKTVTSERITVPVKVAPWRTSRRPEPTHGMGIIPTC